MYVWLEKMKKRRLLQSFRPHLKKRIEKVTQKIVNAVEEKIDLGGF